MFNSVILLMYNNRKEDTMTKIDIISGFLGAGKTTLIRKLIQEAYGNEKLVLIENEFGEIGIDGGFLKEAGIAVKEMNSGCICCSLVGDFAQSLSMVMDQYAPDRIIIEPSGVGKLSDVIQAIKDLNDDRLHLQSYTTVADAKKVKTYSKNFGEFFNNQIAYAKTIVLSRTQLLDQNALDEAVALLQKQNPQASLIVTPWDDLDGSKILKVMEQKSDMAAEMMEEMKAHECCCNHDEHDHHHEECCCHHHDDEHHHSNEHKHHEHCHHHDHEECECHHHHHADEVFTSWGKETAKLYTKAEITSILETLSNEESYGKILRAKGMLKGEHTWYYFDMVPQEYEIREGSQETIGKLCVIGSDLAEEALLKLFGLVSES